MSSPSTLTAPRPDTRTKQPWLWNVVVLDDDEHSYEYVMTLAQDLFAHPLERAFQIAKDVDTRGRAVLATLHLELAELKREQAISFGRDLLVAGSTGPMRILLEPAATDADE